jgi:hypothetical protein
MQQMNSSVIADESGQNDADDHNRSRPAVPVVPANSNTLEAVGTVAQLHDNGTMNATSIHRTRPHHHHRYNFVIMSLLFSANHGCVVACLSLATARLGGALGAWQSGLLYV